MMDKWISELNGWGIETKLSENWEFVSVKWEGEERKGRRCRNRAESGFNGVNRGFIGKNV